MRVSLVALLADELELRAALLRDASADDACAVTIRDICERWEMGGSRWPRGAALEELRLVEWRIHQIRQGVGEVRR